MTDKPWTLAIRKRHRRKGMRRDIRPSRFGFRGSLAEVGGLARLLRHYGLEVSIPKRISPTHWAVTAIVPEGLGIDRLVRFCNLIDRTRCLGGLTSLNVRVFRWLGKDRRQPARFYRSRR